MTPDEFKTWRKALGFSQKEAADALGISASSVELYEKGKRRDDGRPVEIPRSIELACQALRTGKEYDLVGAIWEIKEVQYIPQADTVGIILDRGVTQQPIDLQISSDQAERLLGKLTVALLDRKEVMKEKRR